MIRIGIIGCGKIAQVRHLPEYAANPHVELAGYYDLNTQRAQEMAAQYGGKVYDSYFDLLNDPSIDAVSICVENRSHAEITTYALYAGKHVLCEKPMAVTLAECESMVAAAERNGKHLMIGHNMRFDPVHRKAKELLDGGIIGDIITYFVFTLAGAEMWQRAFAAKSQKAAKEGLFLGTLAYGLTIPLVWFMGVVAHQLVPAEKLAQYGSTDAVVPALAIEILPVGLTGLALAGILSVIMSTADSYLIVSVQTCVHDIYKVFNPNISEKKELRLTRVFAVILPLGALVIALYIKNAYSILMFAWSFYAAAAGLPAFAALYWKKATKAGIIAGMVAGFTVCVGWKLAGVPFGLGPTVPGAIACAAALVGVSLATYRKAPTPFLDPYQNAAGR